MTARLTGAMRLYKHDLGAGERRVYEFGDGHLPGEFVFVPAATDAAEDESWLFRLVINVADETTDFVVFNAGRFEVPQVAAVRLPHRILPGFHGNWFPARQL